MARVRARLRARVRVTVRSRVGLRLRARARARLRARVRVRVRVRDRLRLRLRLRARLRARVRARARWLGLGAAARANAGVLPGPGTHPSGLGEHNARNAPCPKPAACPTLAAPQCQLDLTACDRWGTRRVGRARRGGVWLSRGAPGQSRRAQRALARRRKRAQHGGARQFKLHLTACDRYGMRRVGRAVRGGVNRLCWAIAARNGLRQRRARAAQAAHVPGSATQPTARWHEPAGADERPARHCTVHLARMPPERGRCVAQGRSDGTTAPEAGAAGRGACCWYLLEG